MKKTDLKKILAISGEHGLFEYVAQARTGLIAESLLTKQRRMFGASAKITSLEDVSIYTATKEVSLKDVFTAMAKKLAKAKAMDAKSNPDQIKSFFSEVIPDYDADRFYVSHMKKVLEWYNVLQEFASLEFETEEEEKKEPAKKATAKKTAAKEKAE